MNGSKQRIEMWKLKKFDFYEISQKISNISYFLIFNNISISSHFIVIRTKNYSLSFLNRESPHHRITDPQIKFFTPKPQKITNSHETPSYLGPQNSPQKLTATSDSYSSHRSSVGHSIGFEIHGIPMILLISMVRCFGRHRCSRCSLCFRQWAVLIPSWILKMIDYTNLNGYEEFV